MFQVNILIPIFVTLGAAYLVVAPLTVFPLEGEFIFTFAVAGSAFIFYIPLVRWSWNKKITGDFFLPKQNLKIQAALISDKTTCFCKKYQKVQTQFIESS